MWLRPRRLRPRIAQNFIACDREQELFLPTDTKTLGPAESFRVRFREDAPGAWLYHCHVESHMAAGMTGLDNRVSR
ncbi:MAG: multicopper oxidase domain-containing protein [Solirubrobacteraceae bacterium]